MSAWSDAIIQFVVIVAVVVVVITTYQRWTIARGIQKECPHCRSIIDGKATVCKSCHRDIVARDK